MPFEQTTKKLDNLISSLENELGEKSFPINPDDPWASYRINNFPISNQLQVQSCNTCNYKLTLPFEIRCPLCYFKGNIPDAFPLLSIQEILASLPKENKQPIKQQQGKGKQEKKKQTNNKGNNNGNNNNSNDSLSNAWNKCNIQVSKIVSVEKHPTGDKLFVIQLETGEEQTRQVCAGLVNFYNADDLKDRLVCSVMNLKASKLMGVLSAAMILAGSANDQVRIVEPPKGSSIGDRLFLQDSEISKTTPKTLNSKFWKVVVAEFKVKDGKACVGDKTVLTEKGECSVPDLPNGSEIH